MDVTQTTVQALMKRYGVSRLIHGHTHRPAIHQFQNDAVASQRIVLGDWYSQGSVLRVDADGDFLSMLKLH
jgi:UDP-2,3-diacylglucosamine hydrolase